VLSLRYLCLLLLAGGFGTPAVAGEALSLPQAVTRALAHNPAVRAGDRTVVAAERQADLAGLTPAWVAGADVENVGGTGSVAGVQAAETTVRLGRVLERGGKRDARRAVGAIDIERSRNALDQTRLELATETTRRFVEVLADQARTTVAAQDLALAHELTATVHRWVQAGRSPESDLSLMQIAEERADIEVEHAAHELASARVSLAALWNTVEPDFDTVAGDLFELPVVPPYETLVARLPESPALRALVLDTRAAQARERVAAASAKPDVTVHVGVRRLSTFNDTALIAGISLPLGSAKRSALSVAQSVAETEAADARAQAQQMDVRQRLFSTYQELLHAHTAFEAHRDRMIPKAEAARALTRQGFEAGRFSFVALSQAQRTLLELRNAQIDAAVRYHILLTDIERMTAIAGVSSP
jgi:cobalt-zinc-cadmium efflux system outer membrane protein